MMADMSEYEEVFKRYLTVCNQAIEANKERFPFKQILLAARERNKDRIVEVEVFDTRPLETYALYWGPSGALFKRHENCENCECDAKWRVSLNYLKQVTKNPQLYVSNPAMIDWEWLYAGPENLAGKTKH